jgi:hypothetical protein
MMECTPESSVCYTVYSVVHTVPVVPSFTYIYGTMVLYKCTYGSVLLSPLMPTCPGICGSAAHTGDGVDERNPGTAAVASLVPRHHCHEQVPYIIFKRVLDTSCIV